MLLNEKGEALQNWNVDQKRNAAVRENPYSSDILGDIFSGIVVYVTIW